MAYEKSKKEQKAQDKGQRKIQRVRARGQKQVDKIEGSSPSKTAKLQSKAYRLKKREGRLNQRFGQKAGNVGTSREGGRFGDLDEVVLTPSMQLGSKEKNTPTVFSEKNAKTISSMPRMTGTFSKKDTDNFNKKTKKNTSNNKFGSLSDYDKMKANIDAIDAGVLKPGYYTGSAAKAQNQKVEDWYNNKK
jgi:hypothetical protein